MHEKLYCDNQNIKVHVVESVNACFESHQCLIVDDDCVEVAADSGKADEDVSEEAEGQDKIHRDNSYD